MDDTSHLISAENLDSLTLQANTAVSNMVEWCNSSRLIINANKTTFVNFHTEQRVIDYSPLIELNKKRLTQVSEVKFLGITINETLKWDTHVKHVSSKLQSSSYLLRNLKTVVSKDTIRKSYFGLVYPHLSYGIIFWGCSPAAHRAFIIQKRTVRAMVGAPRSTSCRSFFKDLCLLTLPAIYIYETIMFLIQQPEYSPATNSTIHSHNTRRAGDFHVIAHNLDLFKKNPFYAGSILFNKLSRDIRTKKSNINIFRALLKDYLIQLCPYTVKEYLDLY